MELKIYIVILVILKEPLIVLHIILITGKIPLQHPYGGLYPYLPYGRENLKMIISFYFLLNIIFEYRFEYNTMNHVECIIP